MRRVHGLYSTAPDGEQGHSCSLASLGGRSHQGSSTADRLRQSMWLMAAAVVLADTDTQTPCRTTSVIDGRLVYTSRPG
ncbi:hypothetical protein BST61_g4071 [Cercospora zeina]